MTCSPFGTTLILRKKNIAHCDPYTCGLLVFCNFFHFRCWHHVGGLKLQQLNFVSMEIFMFRPVVEAIECITAVASLKFII